MVAAKNVLVGSAMLSATMISADAFVVPGATSGISEQVVLRGAAKTSDQPTPSKSCAYSTVIAAAGAAAAGACGAAGAACWGVN